MTVKDKQGRILTSENPVICGMWKKAGYEEIGARKIPKGPSSLLSLNKE